MALNNGHLSVHLFAGVPARLLALLIISSLSHLASTGATQPTPIAIATATPTPAPAQPPAGNPAPDPTDGGTTSGSPTSTPTATPSHTHLIVTPDPSHTPSPTTTATPSRTIQIDPPLPVNLAERGKELIGTQHYYEPHCHPRAFKVPQGNLRMAECMAGEFGWERKTHNSAKLNRSIISFVHPSNSSLVVIQEFDAYNCSGEINKTFSLGVGECYDFEPYSCPGDPLDTPALRQTCFRMSVSWRWSAGSRARPTLACLALAFLALFAFLG